MGTIIDLSHVINEGMSVWPGSSKPEIKRTAGFETHGFNELLLKITSHTGTHIDAPAHLIRDGKTLDKFPVEHFIGTACVVQCNNNSILDKKLIEKVLEDIAVPEFLLFHSGWAEKWADKTYFDDFPILTKEAAEYLGILALKGVGIDAPSFDPVTSADLPIHHILMKNGILLLENLCNLEILSNQCDLFCFPLKIENADGSPARIVAIKK